MSRGRLRSLERFNLPEIGHFNCVWQMQQQQQQQPSFVALIFMQHYRDEKKMPHIVHLDSFAAAAR